MSNDEKIENKRKLNKNKMRICEMVKNGKYKKWKTKMRKWHIDEKNKTNKNFSSEVKKKYERQKTFWKKKGRITCV